MRLSLPQLRRPQWLRVQHAEAIAYRVPMNLSAEHTRRTVAPLNYVISLTAVTADGREVTGLGEAQPRVGQTGDRHDRSWALLDGALKDLVGWSLDLADPLASIRRRTEVLESAAGADELDVAFRCRATVMGIETALLDCAAKASGVTLADLLGRRRISGVPPAPAALREADPEALESYFGRRAKRQRGPVRVICDGDAPSDLLKLEEVLYAWGRESARTGGQTLWVSFRRQLQADEARGVIDALAKWRSEGLAPGRIILQNPVVREETVALQRYADDATAEVLTGLDIRIMARQSGPHGTAELLQQGAGVLRTLHLRPGQAGGLLRSLEQAEQFLAQNPAGHILISQFPGASKITRMAHRDLAVAMPGVQHLTGAADVERRFLLSSRESRLRRSPALRLGMGLRLRYEALVARAQARIFHSSSEIAASGPSANEYSDVNYIAPIGSYAVRGHILEREALAYGLNTVRYNKSAFAATDGAHPLVHFRASRWPLSGVVASSVARNKEATRLLLQRHDCPVPQGRTFPGGAHEKALTYADRIGYPVVLKPAEGTMGTGVTPNIQTRSELSALLRQLDSGTHGSQPFIVEKHVRGNDYRIMVIGDEVFAAVERIPASVVGDGVQTIGQLMIQKNMERQRNSHLGQLRVKFNASAKYMLSKTPYSITSVPPAGERVTLAPTNNLTQGGDSVEILEDLHPSIKEASVRATRAVPGMRYCGVDFLLEDHTKPLEEQDAAIVELNAMAALPVAEYPMYGTPRRISERFMRETIQSYGLTARHQRAERLNLSLQVVGRVRDVGYRRWLARHATSFGLSGWVRAAGENEIHVQASGPTEAVSALVVLAVLGPPKAIPEFVRTEHITQAPPDGFLTPDLEDLEAEDEALGDSTEPGMFDDGADAGASGTDVLEEDTA
ncbi:acylphosphatase [Nesterenkonia sp.]|uniref:acylphosphatase n=1 Tax=Nesterenkonia sp. TaxID=704201 RepID=UPI0026049DA0|nr:acylphosphatase [Nesterenkonia sp.]